MENIKISDILVRASCLEIKNTEDKYNKAYYHFIKYFEDRKNITEHDLVIAANFTYGWMPTILNFKNEKSEEFDCAVTILNEAKGNKRISIEQTEVLKKLINNSVVGVSKLLHFINPDVYAIWDSRVCNFLTGKSDSYKVNNIKRFYDYLDLCEEIADDPTFLVIHEQHQKKVGFEITPMRTVEQIMFLSSNDPICG